MAASARRIVVEFLGEDRSLGKTMGEIDGKSSSLMGRLASVGKVAATAVAAGAVAGGAALYSMGEKAGDLNETISKSEQIFGKSARDLQKWAQSGARAFGMSQQTALDAAATFGVFGKSAGKTGDDLAKFSKQNTELAADLASFHNTTPEEAIEALGAAFRGEAEPMRRFGVLLDDASMRQQALAMGLVKTTKEALTPQQKVLTAQALIMKQTSDAQGDFERTSGGLANQQRILKAQFENVQVSIGQKVLPVMLTLATFANDTLIPALGRLGAWLNTNVVPALQRMGQWITTNVVPALQKMGDWISAHVLPVFQRLGSEGPSIFAKIRDAVEAVTRVVVSIAQNVANRLKPVFDQWIDTVRSKVLPTLSLVIDRFQEWWPTIAKVVSKIADLGATIIGTVLPPVIRFAGFLISTLVPVILDTVEVLAKIIGKTVAVGKAFVDGVADVARFVSGLRDKIGNAMTFIGEIPGKAVAALGDLGKVLWNAGSALIQGFIDGITSKVGALKDKLGSITKMIPDLKGPLDKDKILLTPAGEALIEGLIAGIEKKKTKLQTVLTKITENIKAKQDKLAALLDRRQSIVDSFKGFASSVFGADLGFAASDERQGKIRDLQRGVEERRASGAGVNDPEILEALKEIARLQKEDAAAPKGVEALLAFGAEQRQRAEQLNADVKALTAKGLSKDLIDQMMGQGESGMAQIHALAGATDAQIQAVNANNAATMAALEAAGLKASEALIGEQIAQAERDVKLADGIRDKLQELLEKQDKNTVVQLILDGKTLHASLKRLKRETGKSLELD